MAVKCLNGVVENWEAKAIEAVDCMVALEYMESVVVGYMVMNMEGYLVPALYHTFQTLQSTVRMYSQKTVIKSVHPFIYFIFMIYRDR